ncbi:MAG TPA: N-carbamoylputrescine amidase [Methyloceanibacter sp.]|nr:N-carbamoylputrescine amidase [Methyloceanibacter sp.]
MSERKVTVAAIQTSYGHDMAANIAKTAALVREAAKRGAEIVLPSELFQSIYFPTRQDPKWFAAAHPAGEHPSVIALRKLAEELDIVIPISFFEKDGPRYYNSVAIADAGGEILGIYRKSHIPDGPGYQEKYYFRPGDTGFRAWKTKHGAIGVGICWDQWYPEAARAMVLQGAELLLYPTAIGSEPYDLTLDTRKQWQRAMQGHAVANAVPVVAANRVGREENDGASQTYYGHSFMADHVGEIVASFGAHQEGVLIGSFDLAAIERYRAEWGFFRDRRTDLYAKGLL